MPILTTGWAVDAEYNISPDFLVYRFTNVAKGEVCTIEIQNNCVAPLTFNMQQVYLKQAEEAKSKDGAKEKEKGKGKGKSAKSKKIRSKKTATELSEEEALSLETDFTDIDPDLKGIFTLLDLPNNELVVPPFEKASMKIQFKLPQPEKEKKGKNKSEEKKNSKKRGRGSSKGTKRSVSEGPPSKQKKSTSRSHSEPPTRESKSPQETSKKETMRYAAYYHLQLGALVFIKEFYFLATVRGTKQKKKK